MWSTTRPILWESGVPPSGSGSPEASPSSAGDKSSRQPTLVLLAQVSHDPLPGDLHSVVVAHVLLDLAHQLVFRFRLWTMSQRTSPPLGISSHPLTTTRNRPSTRGVVK